MITDQLAAEQPPSRSPETLDLADIRSRVTDLEQHARTLIRQRPVVAVLGAIGVGYLIARLISRGTR